jgi:hypothetical protein
VALPAGHGFATVAEVPDGVDVAAVPLPVVPVEGVLLLAVVVLPVLVLAEGVHGAVVEVVPVVLVPVVPPVTFPALPAVVGVPCEVAGELVELAPGLVV